MLFEFGARANFCDLIGQTPLHFAALADRVDIARDLLAYKADPNLYNVAGQSALVFPLIRHQTAMRDTLLASGASDVFALDYVNTKLLGHRFELQGKTDIVDPAGRFYEIEFEGFFIDFTLAVLLNSVFSYHTGLKKDLTPNQNEACESLVQALHGAIQLYQYQRFNVDVAQRAAEIDPILKAPLLILPLMVEGHAVVFIRYRDLWIRCDRGAYGKQHGTVIIHRARQAASFFHPNFFKKLLYERQDPRFIDERLPELLGLEVVYRLPVPPQAVGNCSWANVEALLPAFLFLYAVYTNQRNAKL